MNIFLILIIIGLTTFATWNHVNHTHKLETLAAEVTERERDLKNFEIKIKELDEQIQDLEGKLLSAEAKTSLEELDKGYQEDLNRIAKKKLLLEINRVKAQQSLTQLENNSPRIGNRGAIRTSQTDQDIINKKHQDEIIPVRAYVVAVEAELLKLAAEELEVERKYNAARSDAVSVN